MVPAGQMYVQIAELARESALSHLGNTKEAAKLIEHVLNEAKWARPAADGATE